MSFPISPVDGQQYTNSLGTVYSYVAANNAWVISGIYGINTTGTLYNPVSRYQMTNTLGSEVWCVSSSTVFANLNWTRSGTTLTINRPNHGHTAGNMVTIRNTNIDFQTLPIATVSTNSFTVITQNLGNSLGAYGAYSLGFTYAHTTGNNGGILYAPTGDHADVTLLSLRIRTGSRVGTVYDLVLPASVVNGAGSNTSLSDLYVPDFMVRGDSDSLVAVAATMTTDIMGSYTTLEFGNLGGQSVFILGHW